MSALDRFKPLSREEKDRIYQEIISECELMPDGGCWIYKGKLNPDGYAVKYIQGKTRGVGRFMLCYQTRESLDINADACHGSGAGCSCTNLDADCSCQGESSCPRSCVNPDHLYWGTHGDNCRERESTSFRFGCNARKRKNKTRSFSIGKTGKTRSFSTTQPASAHVPDLSSLFS
jgi:hypothetical protein